MLNINTLNMPVYRFDNGSCRRGINVMRRDDSEEFEMRAGKRVFTAEYKVMVLNDYANQNLTHLAYQSEKGLYVRFIKRAIKDYLAGKLGDIDDDLAAKLNSK